MEETSALATDPSTLAATYATAWETHDWDTLRSILADDVTFRGPMGTADSADECIAGLQHMAATLDHIDVLLRLSDGHDVITWFDLHSTIAPPTPTVNWTQVEGGKITAIRVTFDPRATLEALARQG
jgi:hypothetical protein